MLIASSASDTQKQMAKNLGQSGSGSTTTAMPVTSGIPNYESQARPQSPTAIPASVQQGVSNGVKAAGQAIGGTPVSAQPVAAQQTTAQPSSGGYPGQLTTAQIAAEAQARIDKQRAALLNAVTGAKTGAKNTYDYTQGLQKDNRALEDAQFQRNSNPFSGGTDYKTAMVNRDRQIADTASSKDYNNVIAGYDAQVASFDTLAPEQQQAAINEMTRIERQYGLDLGSLTGNFNGQQTLAAKTAQQNYDLGLSQQSGQLPNGGGQTLAAQNQTFNQNLDTAKYGLDVKQQHIDLANKLSELFGVKVNPTSDPMQAYAQVAGLSTTAAQKIAADAKQSTFDNAIKLALANNTISQTQANILNQANQLGISQQNANTASNNSTNSQNNAALDNTRADNAAASKLYQDSFSNLMSLYTAKNADTGAIEVKNPTALRAAIIAKNMTDEQTIQMLTDFGLPVHP